MYYDISPIISANSAVFPGDQPFSRAVSKTFDHADGYTLSSITTTLHIGAHADAPIHYAATGQTICQRALDYYFGTCQVIAVSTHAASLRLYPQDIASQPILAPRILFKTNSFTHDAWHDQFISLSPELIAYLASQQVRLVGIDTPSVDPADAKELVSHHALHQHDMAVLECLELSQIEPALYWLMALPLKIAGADASPVRAVLLSEPPQ
jgi:arylformamidase